MEINSILQEYISPMDFIGLVRCIATFEGMDRPETILDFDDSCLAAVWDGGKQGVMVSGTIHKLFQLRPLELVQVAAHEIGHVQAGHIFQPFRRLLSLFSEKRYRKREREADDWAEKYAYRDAWRITYRGWDFV